MKKQRLRLLQEVCSELPFPPFLIALPRVYETSEIDINPHGAVSLKVHGGLLGIKPGEFEWLSE